MGDQAYHDHLPRVREHPPPVAASAGKAAVAAVTAAARGCQGTPAAGAAAAPCGGRALGRPPRPSAATVGGARGRRTGLHHHGGRGARRVVEVIALVAVECGRPRGGRTRWRAAP